MEDLYESIGNSEEAMEDWEESIGNPEEAIGDFDTNASEEVFPRASGEKESAASEECLEEQKEPRYWPEGKKRPHHMPPSHWRKQ